MAVQTVQAIINGETYTLQYDSYSGAYKTTITAPNKSSYNQDNHYYDVKIKATDDAGNTTQVDSTDETFGDSLKLVVKEKNPPVITVQSPTADAFITNNKPEIRWTITDDDSGVDESTIKITVNGDPITAGISKAPSGKGYSCTYTPSMAIPDGTCTVLFDASDHDGNVAVQKSVTFTVDTVAPTLNVTSPEDNMRTNEDTVTVTGTTNDSTSSPVTVTINDEPVEVEYNGSFTKQVTLHEGDNTITIIATDSAGKSTTVVRHVILDTGVPVFQSVEIVPNPVDAGQTYIITVVVTDE